MRRGFGSSCMVFAVVLAAVALSLSSFAAESSSKAPVSPTPAPPPELPARRQAASKSTASKPAAPAGKPKASPTATPRSMPVVAPPILPGDLPKAAAPRPAAMRAGSASHPASKPASSASAASRPASAPSTQPTSGTLSVAVFEPTRPRLRGVLVAYRGARGAAKEATRTKDQALARAQQVERLARQPDSDFALLAKRYSDDPSADVGGLLPPGIVNESKAAEEAFAALQPGQVSHPVETPSGYFVFQRVASFDDMPDGQKMPDQISVRNLLISYCGARGALPGIRRTHDEAKELAVELRTRALDPTVDFQELVLNYSDDPSAVSGGLNDLMRENVSSTFVDLLFRLQPGEVSSVIESPMGFHIFKREK